MFAKVHISASDVQDFYSQDLSTGPKTLADLTYVDLSGFGIFASVHQQFAVVLFDVFGIGTFGQWS